MFAAHTPQHMPVVTPTKDATGISNEDIAAHALAEAEPNKSLQHLGWGGPRAQGSLGGSPSSVAGVLPGRSGWRPTACSRRRQSRVP